MKATYHLQNFQFKRVEFTKAFQDGIRLLMRNAARAFAREVILHVPVQTGFARGSLLNLTDAVGFSAAASPQLYRQKLDKRRQKIVNVPLNGKLSYYTDSGGRVPKTPENARQFASPLDKVFEDNGQIFKFNYEVSILYYQINDALVNPYTPSSPWQSFEKAGAVFVKYIDDNILDKIPAITDYMVTNG